MVAVTRVVREYEEDESSQEDSPRSKRSRLSNKDILEMKPVLETAERFGLSDTAVAHMINANSF